MASGKRKYSGKTNIAWGDILEAYPDIVNVTSSGGIYRITADEIKEFREPRLMTKHDTIDGVPEPLKQHDINVLALGGSPYEFALGCFDLFEPFPDMSDVRPELICLPDFETLRVENITSESNAINALVISQALDLFLGEDSGSTVETFNGRMGSGSFSFDVSGKRGDTFHIDVLGAQLEIDGGFENDHDVVIMEAKNVIHDDFNVRQLYYPYRRYSSFVHKPIRLLFSQYTNLTYRLFEYQFENPNDFSSLVLVSRAAYTFADTRITSSELYELCRSTKVITDDNKSYTDVPFIQADRFDKVLALIEKLAGLPDGMQTQELVDYLGVVYRQGAYYSGAGEYLGIFNRDKRYGVTWLNSRGRSIAGMNLRDRTLSLAGLMFEHEILHFFFERAFESGQLPPKSDVEAKMIELHVVDVTGKGTMVGRRAQSVLGWLRWLLSIPEDE